MRVNYVNDTTQEWNGKRYFRGSNHKDRYFKRRVGTTTVSLHRAVWEHHNGTIPSGHHIHHADGNTHNNQIENLQLMKDSEHRNHHWASDTRRRKQAEIVKKYAMPKAKEWHGTEEGLKWHSEMSKKVWAEREPIEKECAHCHSKFTTLDRKKTARFCHQNCKMNARRRRLRGLPEDAVI